VPEVQTASPRAPGASSGKPTGRQIVVLGALSAFGPLSLDMYLPGLPSLTRELGASASAGQRLLGDRRFSPYAASFSLSFSAMFAYIAGSSFVLENIHGLSPQLFSVVFAVNSAGLIAMTQVGGRLVGGVGAAVLLRRGLVGVACAAVVTLLVTVAGAGLGWLLISFFALLSANGLVLPNGTAAALADQEGALGAASALLGLGQFGCGAVVAPLVGLGGSHDALPMAVVIAVAGVLAVLVDLVFAPRPVRPVSDPAPGSPVDRL
jgi:DHA1 family bicyclomycin/chloramphenicol resistance-like MFS transporter